MSVMQHFTNLYSEESTVLVSAVTSDDVRTAFSFLVTETASFPLFAGCLLSSRRNNENFHCSVAGFRDSRFDMKWEAIEPSSPSPCSPKIVVALLI